MRPAEEWTVGDWMRELYTCRAGCLHPVPDPKDPGQVAAHTLAVRQLAAAGVPEFQPKPGFVARAVAAVPGREVKGGG